MNVDWFNNGVAITLLVGQILVFLPQYIKIYRWGHSLGHHPLFMFMGHLASLLAWINALIYYIYSWNNCKGTEWGCLANVYGLIYYFVQWIFWVFWYIFYLSFLGPVASDYPENISGNFVSSNLVTGNYACRWQSERKKVYAGFLLSLTIGMCAFIRTLLLIQNYQIETLSITQLIFPIPLLNWSYFLEVMVTILLAFCYLPQLYEVVRIAQTASYSLVTLALMIPCNIVWTLFLANWSFLARYELVPINLTNQSTNQLNLMNQTESEYPKIFNLWLPYSIMLFWQITILAFGIYYNYYYEIMHVYHRLFQRLN